MRRCLITGIGGLLGSYLAELLLEKELAVFGTIHRGSENVDHIRDHLTLIPCDLQSGEQAELAVARAQPDVIYHLAAQSVPSRSWREPGLTFQVNLLGTLHLLEAVRKARPGATLVVAGSSAEYGLVPQDELPIREERLLLPSTPYGVSKVAADLLARLYARVHGLRVIRVRPFFVTGPRKQGDVCSDFARGIVAVERREQPCLRVGNLEPVRDFLDVRDAARALWLLAERGQPGEVYNLCSGVGHPVWKVLEMMIGMATRPIPVQPDPDRLRPIDEPVIVGDSSRLRALGWQPQVPLEQTLRDMLEYWRRMPRGSPTAASGRLA